MSAIPPPPPPPPTLPPPNLDAKYQRSKPAQSAPKTASSGDDLLSQLKSGRTLIKTPVDDNPKPIASERKGRGPPSRSPVINPVVLAKSLKNNDVSARSSNGSAIPPNSSKPSTASIQSPSRSQILNPVKTTQTMRFPIHPPSNPNESPPPLSARNANMDESATKNSLPADNVEQTHRVKVAASLQRRVAPQVHVINEESIAPPIPKVSPPHTPPRTKANPPPRRQISNTVKSTMVRMGSAVTSDQNKPPPVPSAPIPSLIRSSKNSSSGSSNQDISGSIQSVKSVETQEENTLSSSLMSKITPNSKTHRKSSRAPTVVDSSVNASSTDLFRSRFKFPSDIAPPSPFLNFTKIYASKVYIESRKNQNAGGTD